MLSNLIGSTTLDVVIGLAFVYFVLSVLCSSIQELLAMFLRFRANDLAYALERMLGPTLKGEVLKHPLISSTGYGLLTRKPGHPEYIPARTFALALIGTLGEHSRSIEGNVAQNPRNASEILVELRAGINNLKTANDSTSIDPEKKKEAKVAGSNREALEGLLAVVESGQAITRVSRDATQLKKWLESVQGSSAEKQEALEALDAGKTLDDVRKSILKLPPSPVHDLVLEWIDGGQTTLANVSRNIETWFDDSMQRLTDLYKRRVQILLVIIAFGVALLTGADTIHMVSVLQNSPAIRAAVVAQAEKQLDKDLKAIEPETMQADLEKVGLLGYPDRPKGENKDPMNLWNLTQILADPEARTWFLQTFVGLLLTTAAVSLGAPFWFDVLKKVANLRAAGPVPEPASGDTSRK